MRKYLSKIITLPTVFFSFLVLFGARGDDTAEEIVEHVQKKYDSIDDAMIKFSQQVKFTLSNAEQIFHGTLYMKRPKKYRIESEQQTFVTDGKTVWSYSPVNKQVLIDHYKEDSRSFSREKFLINIPKNFYASLVGKETLNDRSIKVLRLTPKDDKSLLKLLKLWIEEDSWLVKKALVVERNDVETLYVVKDIKINTDLADTKFTYQIPSGVEVVDLR